jgi:hypothetical protein
VNSRDKTERRIFCGKLATSLFPHSSPSLFVMIAQTILLLLLPLFGQAAQAPEESLCFQSVNGTQVIVPETSGCSSCSYYHGTSSPCGNCGWDCSMSGYPYYCCCGSQCCCYKSYGPCSTNQNCPANTCGSAGGAASSASTGERLRYDLVSTEAQSHAQCQPLGASCKSTSDCCVNLCSPTSCSSGVCIGSWCSGSGAVCQADCQCCSKDCVINEMSPGFCA